MYSLIVPTYNSALILNLSFRKLKIFRNKVEIFENINFIDLLDLDSNNAPINFLLQIYINIRKTVYNNIIF